MILYSLAFLLGDLLLQSMAALPSLSFCLWLFVLSVVVSVLLFRRINYCYFSIVLATGFLWAAYVAHSVLSFSLPHEMEGTPLILTGTVASLVNTDGTGQHFNFYTNVKDPVLIRLSWPKHDATLLPGDVWQLKVRLKRIHGTQNPGGFDVEKWALEEHLRGMGYVIDGPNNQYIKHSTWSYPVAQIRQTLQSRIHALLPHSAMLPWLLALTTGDRGSVNHRDWEVLRKTGTNHLMAIAGLHIGLVALAAKYVIAKSWRLFPRLMLMLPSIEAEACGALIAGVGYAALAGFSLPARRACFMLMVFIVATLLRRKVSLWVVWSLAMLGVLLLDPLSVLSDSFWLSFSTIALVIYGMQGRMNEDNLWWKWGRIQWVIGFGLIPLTLYLYHECSVVSLVANSITIPLLAVLILPLCLLSAVFLFLMPPMGYLFLFFADTSLQLLWMILSWFASLPFASFHIALATPWLLLTAVIAVLLFLLPAGQPGRWLGLIWCLPIIFFTPLRPAVGDVWLTVLDVGQGLSTIVKTRDHTLVYDVGPRISDKMDSGENIVVPYLQLDNRKQIDALVVSHGDNDHIGGAPALLKAFSVRHIYTSVPEKLVSPVTSYCLAGMQWKWDGVDFAFLYPTPDMLHRVNDSSCVLRIKTASQTILLPGDIEKASEIELLTRLPEQLQATVMVAPHHGSKTSGVPSFIAAVYPQYIVYATGYRNKYHFPHPSVVASYSAIHATGLNTVETGAMTLKLEAGRPLMPPERYRFNHHRYWMDGI